MLLAIVAIVAFQTYWLRKNYIEQERNLAFRTNVLFRDALQMVQAAKLGLDTSSPFRIRARRGAAGTLDIIQRRALGEARGTGRRMAEVIISEKSDIKWSPDSLVPPLPKVDSATIKVFNRPGPNGGNAQFIQILRGVESLNDSITVQELDTTFAKLLKEENISLGYVISKIKTPDRGGSFFPVDDEAPNEITIGFSDPVTYRIDLKDANWYILRQMSSQILVSLMLVGLTIFSFTLLLRNLIEQRKLTQLKNDFISNITHELKTPIATVSVAIEALRNFNALHDPQRTKEYLDISANELQRLSLLVDKVLKLSMFEKHQIELREESVDLLQLVEEVVASMKLQFEKYKAKVSVRPQGKDFVIKADRLHVTSVIFNLLDNALKYSKENPSIQIELKSLDNEVELSVTDNGIGIAPEFRKKIFDKFFRVPTGDTHNVKGYGLGLSYVAYVIQRHRGTIDMESQPGIGSRFIIKLLKSA
jgi:Signal transduction histidine kinase